MIHPLVHSHGEPVPQWSMCTGPKVMLMVTAKKGGRTVQSAWLYFSFRMKMIYPGVYRIKLNSILDCITHTLS